MLDIEKYPEEFKRFLKGEMNIVRDFIDREDHVIDIGCGTGRAIPIISPKVKEYVGIDIDKEYLPEAKNEAKKIPNSRVRELSVYNLSREFKENEFDKSFCLFNTVPLFEDIKKALREIYYVTRDKFYFSVCAKGSTKIRQKYYDLMNIEVNFDKNETSHSKVWGKVFAYSEDEIHSLLNEVGFKIEKITIFEDYSFGIIASK